MITKDMIPEVKKVVTDFNNPVFQRYIKSETKLHHVCPICNQPFSNYTNLYSHIGKNHKDQKNTEAVKNALNPLFKVRQLCEERESEKTLTLGEFFAKRITSNFNQNVLLNITAPMGFGKSYSSMYLAEEVAKAVAKIKGGKSSDYFNVGNIAIMKLDSIIPIMEDLDNRKYNIVILDDIGSSYSARDFNNAINKNMNKIFQTFRDTNTMVILTMPALFLIDKVGRNLAQFQIEITESRHHQGINVGKLFEVVPQYRNTGKTHFHFVVHDNIKYTKVIFKRPSDEIVSKYDEKRKAIRQVMMAESIDSIRQADIKQCSPEEKEEKVPKHIKLSKAVMRLIAENPKITDTQLSIQLNTSRVTIGKTKEYIKGIGGL
jgi:hypothetical protein